MNKVFALIALVSFLPLAASQCGGVWSSMFDSWCETNCAATPPFCPSSFCSCATPGSGPTAMAISEFEDTNCCDNPVQMYFIENAQVQRMVIDQNDHSIISGPTTCASFIGPSDIEIDANGNVIVADPVAGAVYVLTGDCTTVNVITSWTFDGIVDQPTALAIGDNGLYVSGSTRVFYFTLDTEYNVITHTQLDFSVLHVDSMDFAPDGTLFLVHQGGYIVRWDGTTMETYFPVHFSQIPDIEGIRVTNCGLYMSITDSNEIWRCSDYDDSSTCEMYCPHSETDSHTCANMGNPYGLTVDCDCNVYSAQSFSGNILFNNDDESHIILPNGFHPRDVEIVVDQDCSAPSPTRTPTPSRSASPSSSVTSSPTPTASSSPSPSESLIPDSSSPSVTPSVTPTPSEQYEQFLEILDYNTVCSAGNCQGANTTIVNLYPASSRSYTVEHSIVYPVLVEDFTDFGQYFGTECETIGSGTPGPGVYLDCTRVIEPANYINFDASTWVTYVDVDDVSKGFPTYATPLARFDVGEYPNPLLDHASLSAVVNCVGFDDVTFRVVIEEPYPIATDFRFGQIEMLRRGIPAGSNSQYVNADGNNPDPLDAFKEFTCIVSV